MKKFLPPPSYKACFDVKNRNAKKFPIPTWSETSKNEMKTFNKHKGIFDGCTVYIENEATINMFYTMGEFGKGSLSRSNPLHADKSKIVEMSQYERRLEWKDTVEKQLGNSALENNFGCTDMRETIKNSVNAICMKSVTDTMQINDFINGKCTGLNEDEILVIDDSSNDQDVECLSYSIKKDPFPIKESFYLNTEEAFFLSYGLDCLSVNLECGRNLSLTEMWNEFCKADKYFPWKYICYHYYRSHGWITLVLYNVGSSFSHASVAVIIRVIDKNNNILRDKNWRQTDVLTFIRILRLVENSLKTLVTFSIILPDDLSSTFFPILLSQIHVTECTISRWIPEKSKKTE